MTVAGIYDPRRKHKSDCSIDSRIPLWSVLQSIPRRKMSGTVEVFCASGGRCTFDRYEHLSVLKVNPAP
jgi:hypothetical protein